MIDDPSHTCNCTNQLSLAMVAIFKIRRKRDTFSRHTPETYIFIRVLATPLSKNTRDILSPEVHVIRDFMLPIESRLSDIYSHTCTRVTIILARCFFQHLHVAIHLTRYRVTRCHLLNAIVTYTFVAYIPRRETVYDKSSDRSFARDSTSKTKITTRYFVCLKFNYSRRAITRLPPLPNYRQFRESAGESPVFFFRQVHRGTHISEQGQLLYIAYSFIELISRKDEQCFYPCLALLPKTNVNVSK